jgi:hypothetical protein
MYVYAGLGQEPSKCSLRPIWHSRDVVRVERNIRFQILALELLWSKPALYMSAPTPLCKSNGDQPPFGWSMTVMTSSDALSGVPSR